MLALGLGIGLSANAVFQRVGTDFRFAEPTSTIVQHGPFARTRNPMYVAMVLIALRISLTVNAAWALAGFLGVALYLHFGVIRREERYLEGRFGDEYTSYKPNVARWIPGLL